MNFPQWLASVPAAITADALWKMEVYRVSLFLGDLAWRDVTKLMQDRRTLSLSDQLYRAVGSISANYCEGYSRSSHKDQVRFHEYSPGSTRESHSWYWKGRHVLSETVALHRIQLLTQIIRHMLRIIPAERGQTPREDSPPYFAAEAIALDELLTNVPQPPAAT